MSIETTITHNIMKYLNAQHGIIMEKVKGEAGCSGRADINGCYKGRAVRIEVKTPDDRNKPSKKQLYNLWQWHRAGAICMVVYSLDAVKQAFEQWKHRPRIEPYQFKMDNLIIDEKNSCTSLVVFPPPYGHCMKFDYFYNKYYDGEIDYDEIQD